MNDLVQYEDLKELLFGKLLGVGIHRKVGIYRPDPSLVIKCATDNPEANHIEMEIWNMVQETDIAKWFAPCITISPSGIFLLQKRVEPCPRSEYPKMVPSFFGDMKYSNYGLLNGRFVCVDYSGFLSTSMSHRWSSRLKKADWWE